MRYNESFQRLTHNDATLDPVTNEVKQIVLLVVYVGLCGVISLCGIWANIANMVVFIKQGFKDSINISLLCLAVADLGCVTTMLWTSLGCTPLLDYLKLPIASLDLTYMTGGYPHVFFNRTTSFMTTFISLERCICIALPLKVKNIITRCRTKVINVAIFSFTVIIFSPFYFVNKLGWKYDPLRNRTVLGITFTKDRELVDSVSFLIHSVALSVVFLLVVTICTIILVVKLHKKARWRNASIAQTPCSLEATSVKEKKVIKMVTLMSAIFIICYIPATVIILMMVCYTEFSVTGKYEKTFYVAWSLAFLLETLNSSVNICVYFNMSTKFKATFEETFCLYLKN